MKPPIGLNPHQGLLEIVKDIIAMFDTYRRSGVSPPAFCCWGDNWECEVLDGCKARLLASPTLAR